MLTECLPRVDRGGGENSRRSRLDVSQGVVRSDVGVVPLAHQ